MVTTTTRRGFFWEENMARKHKAYNPREPARQLAYRKLKREIELQQEQITWLLGFLRGLQHRIEKLEGNKHGTEVSVRRSRLAQSRKQARPAHEVIRDT
jgi:hypothetical protein